ncbi:MAG: copper amine oxidase N-terminal domain-containing protein [Candidatus Eremiobacteraeota bacterium]|nr:copper amine oxidase N-terminal domain-containing protein [Candidatus Eremiobacteraeota bacterium]
MSLKRSISIFLIIILALFIISAPVFAGEVRIKLNGQFIKLDTAPIVRKGLVFVPLRGIFERMNAKVMFYKDQGKIVAHRGKTAVVLKLGANKAKVNGVNQRLLFPPFVRNNRTYVPLRFLSESVGCSVNWHPPTRVVSISTKHLTPKKKKSFMQKQIEGYIMQGTKTKKKKSDSKIKPNIKSDIKSDIKGVKPVEKPKTDKKKKTDDDDDDDDDDDNDLNVDDVKLDD